MTTVKKKRSFWVEAEGGSGRGRKTLKKPRGVSRREGGNRSRKNAWGNGNKKEGATEGIPPPQALMGVKKGKGTSVQRLPKKYERCSSLEPFEGAR